MTGRKEAEKMTIEKDIEQKLIKLAEKYGGRCLKWTCPGWNGVPDRVCLFPGGHVVFVELKRPKGGRVTPLQKWWADEITRLGFLHLFVHDEETMKTMEYFLKVWKVPLLQSCCAEHHK